MVAAPVVLETPSKVAAASLQSLDLSKPTMKPELSSGKVTTSSENDSTSGTPSQQNLKRKVRQDATEDDEGRSRFVGDLERIKCDADEPLLQESQNRFVLFPIKWHEVSHRSRLGERAPPVEDDPRARKRVHFLYHC